MWHIEAPRLYTYIIVGETGGTLEVGGGWMSPPPTTGWHLYRSERLTSSRERGDVVRAFMGRFASPPK